MPPFNFYVVDLILLLVENVWITLRKFLMEFFLIKYFFIFTRQTDVINKINDLDLFI